MPESPTPNMGLILPTDHSDANVWGPILNDALGASDGVDGHNHTSGKGVPVPIAGINFDANLAAGGNQITGLGAVDFTPVDTGDVAALAGAFFVNDADDELYFRTIGGANVKFTNGAALNVGAFTGGIGGDYSSAGALVDYVDASKLYRFRENDSGGRRWAGLQGGFVDLFEWNTLVANRVRLQSPSALAASYAVTWPAALPGSTALAQVTSAGVMTFTNTVVNDITMATDKNINFTGAGKVNHEDKMLGVAYENLQFGAGGTWSLGTPDTLTGLSPGTFDTSGGYGYIDVQGLLPGDRVKQVVLAYTSPGGYPNIAGYRGTWNGGFAWSTTGGSAVTVAGIKYVTYAVDTPVAIGTFDPGGGVLAMSERLRLRIGATSNTTVIYGITLVYDSITTPTYTT